jgi:hypothetical protein
MFVRYTMPFALAAAALLASSGSDALQAAAPSLRCAAPAAGPADTVGGQPVPVLMEHTYRMSGRVRPLLFWIGRESVGSGRIVWREGEGTRAYELLIGTDPALAPKALNRWGYIAEETGPESTRVFGVMTTSEEATLHDVHASLQGGGRRGRYKAIDARVSPLTACAATGTLETEAELTLHDAGALVRQARDRLASVPTVDTALPAGIRPGFLTAVAELVAGTVDARRAGVRALAGLKGRSVPYVYGKSLLDVSITSAEAGVAPLQAAPPGTVDPVHATFEIRSRATGERYRFELVFSTAGALTGVPVLIRYQPRWWLQVDLKREDRPANVLADAAAPMAPPRPR